MQTFSVSFNYISRNLLIGTGIFMIRHIKRYNVLSHVQHFGPHGLYPTRFLCPWNFPARILESGAISFTTGSFLLRDRICVFFLIIYFTYYIYIYNIYVYYIYILYIYIFHRYPVCIIDPVPLF